MPRQKPASTVTTPPVDPLQQTIRSLIAHGQFVHARAEQPDYTTAGVWSVTPAYQRAVTLYEIAEKRGDFGRLVQSYNKALLCGAFVIGYTAADLGIDF
jgi:hypothetical protein